MQWAHLVREAPDRLEAAAPAELTDAAAYAEMRILVHLVDNAPVGPVPAPLIMDGHGGAKKLAPNSLFMRRSRARLAQLQARLFPDDAEACAFDSAAFEAALSQLTAFKLESLQLEVTKTAQELQLVRCDCGLVPFKVDTIPYPFWHAAWLFRKEGTFTTGKMLAHVKLL